MDVTSFSTLSKSAASVVVVVSLLRRLGLVDATLLSKDDVTDADVADAPPPSCDGVVVVKDVESAEVVPASSLSVLMIPLLRVATATNDSDSSVLLVVVVGGSSTITGATIFLHNRQEIICDMLLLLVPFSCWSANQRKNEPI